MDGERGNGSASVGSDISPSCSQHACPPGREGFPLLLWLLNSPALALSSRLQDEDWSVEMSRYPSVTPRSWLLTCLVLCGCGTILE